MLLKRKGALSEQKLAAREDWSPCEWKDPDAYFRAIVDILYPEENVCNIQDWKTGQIYESHKVQLEDYVAVVAAHYPGMEYHTRAIYIDLGVVEKPKVHAADRVKPIRLMLDGRIKNAEADEIFPTRAGVQCKWCDYSSRHGGPCRF